jgi:hypothetical protein
MRERLVEMLNSPEPHKALMVGWQEEMDALKLVVRTMIGDLSRYYTHLDLRPAGATDDFDLHDLWQTMNAIKAFSSSVDSFAAIIEDKKPKE